MTSAVQQQSLDESIHFDMGMLETLSTLTNLPVWKNAIRSVNKLASTFDANDLVSRIAAISANEDFINLPDAESIILKGIPKEIADNIFNGDTEYSLSK